MERYFFLYLVKLFDFLADFLYLWENCLNIFLRVNRPQKGNIWEIN